MRISDWSSDVCSSDLGPHPEEARVVGAAAHAVVAGAERAADDHGELRHDRAGHGGDELGAVAGDRKSAVQGKRGSVRLALGGRRRLKTKKYTNTLAPHPVYTRLFEDNAKQKQP